MQRIAWGLGIFTIAWSFMVVLVTSLRCIPLRALWVPNVHAKCINFPLFSIVGSVPDVVVDFIILLLPMPAVWNLQKVLVERISLMAVFALGSLCVASCPVVLNQIDANFLTSVCIISLVRLVQLVQNQGADEVWMFSEVSVWSTGGMSIHDIEVVAKSCQRASD